MCESTRRNLTNPMSRSTLLIQRLLYPIQEQKRKLICLQFALFLVAALVSSCSLNPQPPTKIEKGLSRDEVIVALGEPDQIQDFVLPDQPFFGPQEGLINIVPPGTTVEEWVYETSEEVLLVWFAGEPGEKREDWKVIETGRYPAGAVF